MASRVAALAALSGAVAVLVAVFYAPLSCPRSCIVDHVALRGPMLGHLELPDVRLNTWIVAWVQHALLSDPSGLFDANVFYPARNTLTQSEHMLAVAAVALPLRGLGADAVAVHQLSLLGSTLLLCLFTGALVRWLTGSAVAALAAGLAAGLMPWRLSELSHLQLMSVQWFPLVWLCIARLALDPPSRRATLALALVLGLQLLSSFYLAYFLLESCAALLVGLAWSRRISARSWRALATASLAPVALFLAMALPYARWRRTQGFEPVTSPLFDSVSPSQAFSFLLSAAPIGSRALPIETTYQIPLAIVLLGIVAVAIAFRARHDASETRRRGCVAGLLLACLVAFVLVLGRELRIGDVAIPLPSQLAAAIVPGFEVLRNPLRWSIVIGVAAPVLAGVGIAHLERAVRTPRARRGVQVALLLVVVAGLPLPRIPVRPAWEFAPERIEAYRALAKLPPGPVIELPWPLQIERDVSLASSYMLGSTLHWKPLLNGYSGYLPPSYPLIRQIAHGLPGVAALARLRALVDVRWLVVHLDDVGPTASRAWARAEREGRVQRVLTSGATHVYEIPGWTPEARHLATIRDPSPRTRTLEGLSRAPLAAGDDLGGLSLEVLRPFYYQGGRRVPQVVAVHVTNAGSRPWPGLDVDPEGLVALHYVFLDAEGGVAMRKRVPLAADVAAGSSAVLPLPIAPPTRVGRYTLRAELVQRVGDEERPLAVPPYELEVEVRTGSI